MRLRGALGLLMALAAATPSRAGQWAASWSGPPDPPVAFVKGDPPTTFENQTVRQMIRLSAGGAQLRLRLTNEYGRTPMRVAAVRVALAGTDYAPIAGSTREVRFAGKSDAWMAAGAPIVSDSVNLPVKPLQRLIVAVYYAAPAMPGGHLLWVIVASGDQGPEKAMRGASIIRGPAIVSGVEVLRERPAPVIVTFGDSITEGIAKTTTGEQGWPQLLAARFAADARRRDWSVVNAGIGGNRLLHDGFAESALARFDRDALAIPGVTHILLQEGINDIGWSILPDSPAAAEDVISAQRQLVERAHARGIKVIGATLPPFKGAIYYTPAADAMRQRLNAFIRTSGVFDGVVDFERAVADPGDPSRLNPAYDPGDHLHPNDAGNAAMAAAVPSGLFEK